MSSHASAAGAERPTLGPHVVGRRVVVRRVVRGETGPSGGPALTDVLGVCTAWADGTVTVHPGSGPAVTIPLGDVVGGKPVPPPPRRRGAGRRPPGDPSGDPPADLPADLQRRATALFPDLVAEPLGSWLLRASDGSAARRANSVLAFGPASVADPVAAVAAWYAARGRRPVAAVLTGSPEVDLLVERGWVPESSDADTLFQVAPLDGLRAALPPAAQPVELTEHGPGLVSARLDHRASGVAAFADGWVGFRSIEVDPAHRRRGLALAVMRALADRAADRGAHTAYLQVLGHNEPALALYCRLGFSTHHAYRYLAAP